MRKVHILLLFALLPSMLPRLFHPIPSMDLGDLNVYYTAATLAREHQGIAIYSGADTGIDPQLQPAQPGTAFAEKAKELGAGAVQLYVYPPVLADLLIPLTWMSLTIVSKLWVAINLGIVLLTAVLMVRMLGVRVRSVGFVVLLAALLISQPIVSDIAWGQITAFLLLLWTAAIWCYQRGSVRSSAALFALATGIKLTPLIVFLPFLIWKEWKWLRWYAASLLLVGVAVCAINTPQSLTDYFGHVVPAMSHGVAHLGNESIPATIQLVYVAMHGGGLDPVTMTFPKLVVTAGKLLSLAVIGLSVLIVLRVGSGMAMGDRMLALALFAMLSAVASPVSWRHAYAVALVALVWLWWQALRKGRIDARAILLAMSTVLITSYLNQWAIAYLERMDQHVPAALLTLVSPGIAVALILVSFSGMRRRVAPAKLTAA